jgi:hypothetical protein
MSLSKRAAVQPMPSFELIYCLAASFLMPKLEKKVVKHPKRAEDLIINEKYEEQIGFFGTIAGVHTPADMHCK